jgi:hypothetical protein
MEWAAWMNAAGGQQVAGALPRRPAAGAALARAHLEYRGAHRAPELNGPRWVSDPAILRRVRDALTSGGDHR